LDGGVSPGGYFHEGKIKIAVTKGKSIESHVCWTSSVSRGSKKNRERRKMGNALCGARAEIDKIEVQPGCGKINPDSVAGKGGCFERGLQKRKPVCNTRGTREGPKLQEGWKPPLWLGPSTLKISVGHVWRKV